MNAIYKMIEYTGNMPINVYYTRSLTHSGHFHEDIEVIYVLKGKTRYRNMDTIDILTVKDIIVINSNEIHSFQDDKSTEAYYMVMQLKPSFFELLNIPIKSTKILCNSKSTTKENVPPFCDYTSVFDSLRRDLDAILNVHRFPEQYPYINLVSSVLSVLSIILKNFSAVNQCNKNKARVKDESLSRVSEIIEYLNENYKDDITISYLAEKYHISVSHLCHIFKKTVGISIVQYLNNLRLEKMKEMLLLNQEDSITNIALDSGFRNLSYFYNIFQKKIGCTPSKFREAHFNSKYSNKNSSKISYIENIEPNKNFERIKAIL